MLARAPEVQKKHSESTTPAEGRGLDLDTVFTKLHQLKLSLRSTIMTCQTKNKTDVLLLVNGVGNGGYITPQRP